MNQLHLNRPQNMPIAEWLAMHDIRHFLEQSRHRDIAIHYLHIGEKSTIFLSSVLMPRRLVTNERMDQLRAWNFSPIESKWGYSSGGRGSRLISPFARERPAIYQKAVPVLTARHNTCLKDQPVYFDVNPQITQVHDLHWLEERSAYCMLDDNGDIRDVISLQMNGYRGQITIAEDVCLKHLLLGDYVLIRFFDVDRRVDTVTRPDAVDRERAIYWQADDLHAKWTPVHAGEPQPSRAYLRGLQIIRAPRDRRARKILLEGNPVKQFCTYIALDWKHDRIADVSCDPSKLGNYYVESRYPYETSPAFFRREVLFKYQSDPDKYTVHDQRITCRSAWDLRYDVNDAEQVHALLIDLGRIPYVEQLHWKSYNEPPKAGISERSFRTGFLGEWYDEPEPLRDLKQLMETFPQATAPGGLADVWQKPSGLDRDLASRIHYLAGSSQKEWEIEIVALDKFIVEGLNLKFLRRVADQMEIDHQKLASISLLREIVVTAGIAPDIVASMIDPLRELQDLRSRVASHRKGDTTAVLIRQIRKDHKDLPSHYKYLIRSIYQGMSILADLIKRGTFNLL